MSSGGGRGGHRRPSGWTGGDFLGGDQVEGHHAVGELLRAGRRRALRVWASSAQAERGPVAELVALAGRRGVPVALKAPEALASAAQTAAPQGVVAWAEPVRSADLDLLVAAETGHPPFLVCLDGVTDPGNFGSVLRTALCAGVDGVVVGRHRSALLTPAAVKAAAGAVEHLPVAAVPGVPAALARLSSAGIWCVGLDAGASADICSTPVLGDAVALVMGAEGRGLSPLAARRCDTLVRIPQSGLLGSLNVAAAAAVACFEVARRRYGAESRA